MTICEQNLANAERLVATARVSNGGYDYKTYRIPFAHPGVAGRAEGGTHDVRNDPGSDMARSFHRREASGALGASADGPRHTAR
jgi:hypothetical protein